MRPGICVALPLSELQLQQHASDTPAQLRHLSVTYISFNLVKFPGREDSCLQLRLQDSEGLLT